MKSDHDAVKEFDLETYRTLVAYNSDILFEWDLVTDRFFVTPNIFDIFGYLPSSYDFSKTIRNSVRIHPEDKARVEEYFETLQYNFHDLTNRKFYSKMEIRIRNAYNAFIWCRVRLAAYYSSQNLPYKIEGMITDIDFAKKQQESFIIESQRDPFTGLYNYDTALLLISEALKQTPNSTTHALLLIDIDNFNRINERFGKLYGDAALADLTLSIKKNILGSDIVGRVGGDQFIIFIKEVPSMFVLKRRLNDLQTALRRVHEDENEELALTSSIAIALYPAHGKTLERLLESTVQTLGYIKSHGKNQYQMYRDRMDASPAGNLAIGVMPSRKPFYENLGEYAFQILNDRQGCPAAVRLVLEITARHLALSRAYIAVMCPENEVELRFEWRDTDVMSPSHALQELGSGGFSMLYADCGAEQNPICGVPANCGDSLKGFLRTTHTTALFHRLLLHNGVLIGCIAFEDCAKRCEWTATEKDLLSFVSGTIAVFLRLAQLEQNLKQIEAVAPLVEDEQDLAPIREEMDMTE